MPTNYLVTTSADSGTGSLRQAILNANADTAADTITFQILSLGVPRISLVSALPALTHRASIDGTTQSQHLIELDGTNAGTGVNGLTVNSDLCTIRGLVLNNFSANGILISGDSNAVKGCRIGTNVAGTAAAANFLAGIDIASGAGNEIGGTVAADRNLISGNRLRGVVIETQSFGNTIEGNYIGTDITGSAAISNDVGLFIQGNANFLGGMDASHRNLISGNDLAGVSVGGSRNTVAANYIGTDVTGQTALANGTGIFLAGAQNKIGTPGLGSRNVISGNVTAGISGAGANFVWNDLIGTDFTGTVALPNDSYGINIDNVSGLTIGGTSAGQRNVISGNSLYGIFIRGTGGTATANVMEGNYIGLDISGAYALGNGVAGVWIQNASGNTVGGTDLGARNVISANGQDNVHIVSASGAGGNTIIGNLIGTDANGVSAFSSSFGIHIIGSINNIVGGTTAQAANAITGCTQGIVIEDFDLDNPATGNRVLGNLIGTTDRSGVTGTGNAGAGVLIDGASGNQIGGTDPGAGNLIAFNHGAGVYVSGGTGNSILGNSIYSNNGLGIDLAPLGVNPNDPLDADAGANNGQNYPVLASAVASPDRVFIRGALDSSPNQSFRMEFFSVFGAHFLGSISVQTNAQGHAGFLASLQAPVQPGQSIVATATNSNNDTSEFSDAITSIPGYPPWLATAAGAGRDPEVKVLDGDSGQMLFDFNAYPAPFRGGVRVATADINGDGILDIVTAPGGVIVTLVNVNGALFPSFDISAGRAPEIKVFSGANGTQIDDFLAYPASFTAGVFVAVGDVNHDGKPDIVTGPDATGQSGHTNVRVFFNNHLINNGATLAPDREFNAYDPGYGGGVRLAAADLNGDGYADIVTAPGIWSGPDIRIFNGQALAANNAASMIGEFLAYDFRYFGGVFVASGDVNGDGKPDIVTGTNGNGGPEVKAFSGANILSNPGPLILDDFYAYDPAFNGGVRVALVDANRDGKADIVTGAGAGGGPHVRIFDGGTGLQLSEAQDSFYAFEATFAGGVFVGGQ